MIELSNGHKLEFLAASGSLAFDGRGWFWEWPLRWIGLLDPRLFTIVTKTIMLEPWKGNFRRYAPLRTVKFVSGEGKEIHPIVALTKLNTIGGVVNAIGLTGPGFDKWLARDYHTIERMGYKVVVSITGPNGGNGCVEMARRLNGLENVVGIEFNASCPNTDPTLLQNAETVVRLVFAIKQVSDHPLLLKLGYTQPYLEIARALQGMVEAISINSVPWNNVFPKQLSPLAKYGGGGVSGPVAQPFVWEMIKELKKGTNTPVIGAGIWEYEDILCLQSFGASAFQLGTIFLPRPWKPTQFVRRWERESIGLSHG